MSTWTATFDERPWTLNAERRWHHYERAKHVKEWREKAWEVGKKKPKVPKFDRVLVVVRVGIKGVLQDVGNAHGCTKAIVDGLVDAGMVPDDKPEHLLGIVYIAPVRDTSSWISVTVHDMDSPMDYSFLDEL